MSFLAAAPSTANTTPPVSVSVVENDGFYPDIHLPQMRDAMRLDGTVTDPRLLQAVVVAVIHVNNALRNWKLAKIAAGYASMTSIPADHINRESVLLAHYKRAVYSTAKADLMERYRDYDSTASASSDKKTMEWLDSAPGDQRRNAHWAIADIIDRAHLTVELI